MLEIRPKITDAVEPPQINLQRLEGIDTFEVLAVDLDRLDELFSQETRALGFCTSTLSVALSAFISWMSIDDPTPTQIAVFLAMVLAGGITGAFFGLAWWRASHQRPTLIKKLKDSAKVRSPA